MEIVALLAYLFIISHTGVAHSAAIRANAAEPSILSPKYLKTVKPVEVSSHRVSNKMKSNLNFNGQIIPNKHGEDFNEVLDSFLDGNTVNFQDKDEVQQDILSRLQDSDLSFDPELPSYVHSLPPYMMDLYYKFSKDRHTYPTADITRSFPNQGSDGLDGSSGTASVTSWKHETPHGVTNDHYLLFNITMPSHETVVMAQLRIFVLVANSNTHYGGIARTIVYHDLEVETKLLTSQVMYRQTNGWESLDLTSVVRLISQSKVSKNPSDVVWPVLSQSLRLRIHLQPLIQTDGRSYLDVDISHAIGFEPLLVVYSDDENVQHMDYLGKREVLARDRIKVGITSNVNSATIVRSKRDGTRHRHLCKRRPMQVIFKDIGWDNWVIAPRRYQAFKCSGKCIFPLTEHWSPTVHSIIQTLAHEYDPAGVDNPCCVPTHLGPISMLYLDENNVLTYKYRYEGMVVKKCGCH